MTRATQFLIAAALAALPGAAIEITTGQMLGTGFDRRSFYVREKTADPWVKTYSGPAFRPEAAGRLMNLRVAQAITHDEWLTEEKFDPDANTRRAIAALDDYKKHGILAISISFQGANFAYERTANIKRIRPYSLGPGKGSLNSAFLPDGALKAAWMKRALLLARELDKRGMILNATVFYQYQDEIFESPEAILRGARNFADWLIENNIRNVIIDMANEHDARTYDHGGYISREMPAILRAFRARFEERKAGWRPPMGASTLGGKTMSLPPGVAQVADITFIHGNHADPAAKRRRTEELYKDAAAPGPIYMNEDDNGRETTLEHLERELGSCDAVFAGGGSWGYMPWVQLQIWPIRNYRPGTSSQLTDSMPVEQRDAAYFKKVLEHIRAKLYR
jgi:hypothetical protein